MSSVATTKLFKLTDDRVVAGDGPVRMLPAGTILWQHGNRKSSVSGYIGTFSETYTHTGGTMISPKSGRFEMKTEHVEPFYF